MELMKIKVIKGRIYKSVQALVFEHKFMILLFFQVIRASGVVLVHNTRSNDSRSNDARFMPYTKLYLSLDVINRLAWGILLKVKW